MSHLFNVAHTLRMMVQKERSLDILKVRAAGPRLCFPTAPVGRAAQGAMGLPAAATCPFMYVCVQTARSAVLYSRRSFPSGPYPRLPPHMWGHLICIVLVTGDSP